MVTRKNIKNKYALISVYNKNKLKNICKNLNNFKYKLISTGSTKEKIIKLGYDCISVSSLTGFDEILEGRVKTLNPKIHGSILFDRNKDNHIKEFNKLNVPAIDIVIVNLYPFIEESKKNKSEEKVIENIDIGGVSLLRSASKNYKYVTCISDIEDYEFLVKNLKLNNGTTDISFRKKMASKVFNATSNYDKSISNWFSKLQSGVNKSKYLKYGENPHQKSFITNSNDQTIFDYLISGQEISYNNIIDIDSGINCINEFMDPTCLIIKHTIPCGAASDSNIGNAFLKAFQSDKKSAFGGVIILNRKVTIQLAKVINRYFFEVIVAPVFTKEAIKILNSKKNLKIFQIKNSSSPKYSVRTTNFGDLYQEVDRIKINKKFIKNVTKQKISKNRLDDIIFALKIVRHLKSNAIVLCYNKQTVGIGSGQTNRIGSLEIAIKNFKMYFKNIKFVCASDGFFPFNDGLMILKKNKCKIIAQPSGSKNDDKAKIFSEKNKISLFFIESRLFKH